MPLFQKPALGHSAKGSTIAEHYLVAKHYLVAFIGVTATAALRYALDPMLGGLLPGIFFAVPVVITALYGGLGPGIFATVLSALTSTYLFVPPYFSFRIESGARAITVLSFLVIGLIISLLGRRLKDLQSRTEQQAQLLQEESKKKDDFLATLAHELRNPLAGISTAAALLKFGHLDERRLATTSDVIARQVQHMVKLVDDLLDVSRLTRGLVIIDKHPVDMKDIVGGAVDQTQSLFAEKAHRLILQMPSEPACVCGDYTRLVQVVANLLNNAARYTPEGGETLLEVLLDSDEVELLVRDNGVGLEPSLLSCVFEPFFQAQSSAGGPHGGLGLGLAVVQKITSLHGGTVTAHSEGVGRGSTFAVRLPRWKKGAETGESESAQNERVPDEHTGGGRHLSLLVVDDNEDVAHGLATILETQGHTVHVAYNAKQALDMSHTEDFDGFLLDIGLPNVDGYELVRLLRLMPHASAATFMAVSGFGTPDDKERSKAAGFHHHFVKPVNLVRLAEVLGQITPVR